MGGVGERVTRIVGGFDGAGGGLYLGRASMGLEMKYPKLFILASLSKKKKRHEMTLPL
jgi:hypothetical protein